MYVLCILLPLHGIVMATGGREKEREKTDRGKERGRERKQYDYYLRQVANRKYILI